MSQAGLPWVCKWKFANAAVQLDARLICRGATSLLLFPQLFLFANSTGLKDTAQWQESYFPPLKAITKRSCSYCHRAQGARTARQTGSATSPPAFPAEHEGCPSPKRRGRSTLSTGLGRQSEEPPPSFTHLPLKPTNTSFTNPASLVTRCCMMRYLLCHASLGLPNQPFSLPLFHN